MVVLKVMSEERWRENLLENVKWVLRPRLQTNIAHMFNDSYLNEFYVDEALLKIELSTLQRKNCVQLISKEEGLVLSFLVKFFSLIEKEKVHKFTIEKENRI